MKNYLKITCILICVSIGLLFSSCEGNTCANNHDYTKGYDMGYLTRNMGGTTDPEQFVKSYNYNTGRNIMKATKCFKIGFNDGVKGKPRKQNKQS